MIQYGEDVVSIFLKDNEKFIFNTICEDEDFPYICEKISIIIGSYLDTYFENIKIVDGFYEEERHWWIDTDNYKIDFTLSQFIFSALNEFNNLNYIPYIIRECENNNIFKKYNYESFSYEEPCENLIQLAKENKNFVEYFKKAIKEY